MMELACWIWIRDADEDVKASYFPQIPEVSLLYFLTSLLIGSPTCSRFEHVHDCTPSSEYNHNHNPVLAYFPACRLQSDMPSRTIAHLNRSFTLLDSLIFMSWDKILQTLADRRQSRVHVLPSSWGIEGNLAWTTDWLASRVQGSDMTDPYSAQIAVFVIMLLYPGLSDW